MNLLRRLAAVGTAAVMVMAGGTLVARADDTPSVYNTPGGQISGDRLWNTSCEKYSSDVVRCRAEIWATQVSYVDGRYVKKTGWTFNNLTYLPSPRASWEGNNLGRSNPSWSSGGRTWKTECDTATTGRGGCRSYVWTKKVVAVKFGSGYVYRNDQQWVFNNLVLFSSSAVPGVTRVPAWIIDQSRLDSTGLGPLRVGTSMEDLKTLGYFKYPGDVCEDYGESQSLQNRGIDTFNRNGVLSSVILYNDEVSTVDGARVGMTYGDVKRIYGDRMSKVTKKDAFDEDVPTAVVDGGAHELVFTSDELRPLRDSDPITMIVARRASDDFFYDGC